MRGCSYVIPVFLGIWLIWSLVVGLGVYAIWNVVAVSLFAVPALTFVKSWVVGIAVGLFITLIKS